MTPHRVPRYPHEILTKWYMEGDPVHTSRVMKYMVDRTIMVLRLLDASETITKTAFVHCLYFHLLLLISRLGSSPAFSGWIGSPSLVGVLNSRSNHSCFASQSPRVWFCFLRARKTCVRPAFFTTITIYPALFCPGWKAERRRVHAVDHGTKVGFLQQSIARPGFPILVPVNHDRL